MVGRVAVLVFCGLLAGCSALGPLGSFFGERMTLAIQVDGPKAIPKTVLGEIPVPTGGVLAAILLDAYGAQFLERVAELDNCTVATTHEPPEPPSPGTIVVSATMLCMLGPEKREVREVVTFTLSPVLPG